MYFVRTPHRVVVKQTIGAAIRKYKETKPLPEIPRPPVPSLRRDRYTVGTSGYNEALHYITNDRQAPLGPKRPEYCRGRF